MIMLNVIMLSVDMLNVVMLSVIILGVVAPQWNTMTISPHPTPVYPEGLLTLEKSKIFHFFNASYHTY
jgi:hypothetical protein